MLSIIDIFGESYSTKIALCVKRLRLFENLFYWKFHLGETDPRTGAAVKILIFYTENLENWKLITYELI